MSRVLVKANGGPVVGVGQGVQRFLEAYGGYSVWTVLIALATLVFYHVALDVQPLLVKGVQQESHPVSLQP